WEAARASLRAAIDPPAGQYARVSLPSTSSCEDDTWTSMSAPASPVGVGHAAVWTGSEMIVFGGCNATPGNGTPVNRGARYDPATNTWTAISPALGGCGLTAVWTGSQMIIWGGGYAGDFNSEDWNEGGRYDPASNTWASTSTGPGVPSPRHDHTA